MIETASVALATFFATVGPLDVAMIFAALTARQSPAARLRMAVRGTLTAAAILFVFALFGETLLSLLGISLAALRTAGGILLLLIGIELVFARTSGATSTTEDETREAEGRADISIFPLATPLIAGPGTMGAAILLMANAEGDLNRQLTVLASMLAVLLFTLACLITASQLQKLLGRTGTHVVNRIFGVLLSALAVQFIFDGITESGVIG
ncbi:MAG: MarC family protein [Desulfobulbaceae bacterium]|jgi:multiple antibiotic resistance protein|nr:MarC family protein [Desulfobulbaceae bacterium]MDY0351521.1 MarC family protein [Desulfobulbaceae bacterium]